jgi:hypothetical protein
MEIASLTRGAYTLHMADGACWVRDGCIYGRSGYTGYWVQDNHVYGPSGYSGLPTDVQPVFEATPGLPQRCVRLICPASTRSGDLIPFGAHIKTGAGRRARARRTPS